MTATTVTGGCGTIPAKKPELCLENFSTGNQVLFMDPYVVYYPREHRNMWRCSNDGISRAPDTRWDNFRDNLGYILKYSRKLNLANVMHITRLVQPGIVLAQTPASGAEYLYTHHPAGQFTLDLSAMPNSSKLSVEWFNPATEQPRHNVLLLPGQPPIHSAIQRRCGTVLVDTAGHR